MAKLEVLNISLQLIASLRSVIAAIALQDRDLADQLRRAASSAHLNMSEGARRMGRDRNHSYRIAAGSAAEVRSALAVAQAWGYVSFEAQQEPDQLADRVLAMLWRLTQPKS